MKITLTQFDRYRGQVAGPFDVGIDPSIEFDVDQPDHDVLEHLFTTGYAWVGCRVTIEREGHVREWRCDPEGWSIVIDPAVHHCYVIAATGEGVAVDFYPREDDTPERAREAGRHAYAAALEGETSTID